MRLSADAAGISEAAVLLMDGQVVAMPTETVYGLAAVATDTAAVAKIFAAKERPTFDPLIVHCRDAKDAFHYASEVPDVAARLAQAFWPGPMTLVLPKHADGPCAIDDLVTAGLSTVALRVPSHPVARDVLMRVNAPLAAPSANRFGHISPTSADHVLADLNGRIAAVLDGGETTLGLESTIVACVGDQVRVLRQGMVTSENIVAIDTGNAVVISDVAGDAAGAQPDGLENAPKAPGMMGRHYAPRKPMMFVQHGVQPDASQVSLLGQYALLGVQLDRCDPQLRSAADSQIDLSTTGDLVEAAARLFMSLRQLEAGQAQAIVALGVPNQGLGRAINDRLRRASHRNDTHASPS